MGISYDSQQVLANFASKSKIEFPLLSDAESKVIDAYGIRNEKASGGQAGIPHPMTVVIDKAGNVRAKLMRDGPYRRHSNQELFDAVADLQ